MKYFFSIISFNLFFVCVSLCPENVLADTDNSNSVTVAALNYWPPQYLIDEKTGEPLGFAIEVMNKVAALIDLEVRYAVYDTWSDIFEAFRLGKVIISPNLGITDERLGLYDFTVPYDTFRICIFVRDTTTDIADADDLVGRKVGVVDGNQGVALMRERGGSDLANFHSIEEAFLALLSGGIDALVYPEQSINAIAMRSGLENKIRIVGKALQEIKRGVAVRKGEPELFSKINNAMINFIKTPEYQKIYEKWYGKPKPFWTLTKLLVFMVIAIGLTIAGMLAWRYVSILKMNRTLSEAEKRFRGIVENSNAGYFFIDREG
jgi:ABC-type amino acid transport substrate-binding protein